MEYIVQNMSLDWALKALQSMTFDGVVLAFRSFAQQHAPLVFLVIVLFLAKISAPEWK